MGVLVLSRTDRWLARFGEDVPTVVHLLRDAVLAATASPARLAEIREGAEALGVLRAQQGHAVAGLVEDVLALRELAGSPSAHHHHVVDVTLRLAVAAYVDELSAVLASRATRDPLTGLPNRAALEEALEHEIASVARGAAPALLLVDLDKFKLVNDTDGHLAGDDVLIAVADVLRASVRPSDLACRLGGDEFAVVLPRTGAGRALQVGQRLVTAARNAPGLSSANARVTLSIGVGWLGTPTDPATLMALADAALYAVKGAGGNGVRGGRPTST